MKRWMTLLVALLTLAGCSTGCLDAHSLDQYGYALSIGFDEGKTLPYRITIMVENTQSDSDSQTSGGFTLLDAECRNLFEAAETLVSGMPYQLNFSRTELLVISGKLLRKEGELKKLLNFSMTQLRIRYNACVFASLSDAYDALEGLKNALDPNLARLQKNFVTYSKETGLISIANLMTLSEALTVDRFDALLPLCGKQPGEEKPKAPASGDSAGPLPYAYLGGTLMVKSGMKTGLAGGAILTGGTMTGILAGQRVQIVLMATRGFEQARMQMVTPGGQTVSVLFERNGAVKTAVSLVPKPRAAVTVPVTAVVEQSIEGEQMDDAMMEAWLATSLSSEAENVFRCCRALRSDLFGFGKVAAKHFARSDDWDAYAWKDVYAELEATFTFAVSMKQATDRSVLE